MQFLYFRALLELTQFSYFLKLDPNSNDLSSKKTELEQNLNTQIVHGVRWKHARRVGGEVEVWG